VTVRVAVALPGAEPEAGLGGSSPGAGPQVNSRRRRAWFQGEWHETAVLSPEAGRLRGPAIVELPGSTLVVPPGWSGRADGESVVIER